MISFSTKGNWDKTSKFLDKIRDLKLALSLDKYGEEGVEALSDATPKDTGKTAASWNYRIERDGGSFSIVWTNSNVNDGVNIAIILQYGHGTRNGGYVKGIDYINPALRPVFDKISKDLWREVERL